MQTNTLYILILIVLIGGVFWFFLREDRFEIPSGETMLLNETEIESDSSHEESTEIPHEKESSSGINESTVEQEDSQDSTSTAVQSRTSKRELFVTDGTRHSIPLNEILSGGPPKDGIPSIDDPKFISAKDAEDFLSDESVGLGVSLLGEYRFYPYQILVWHEIVNDTIGDTPVLVTYCPLCATGVVFDRRVNGVEQEFGVSGLLWQSNLLMYNRTGDPETESLWSQVLGEAVLGPETGDKLGILRSDTVRFNEWRDAHPDTKVLSRDTGTFRTYGIDPYGDYYTDRSVSFGATFNDDRLHPKAFVIGIEINGRFKAYAEEDLPVGTTRDTFAGEDISIEKNNMGQIDVFAGSDKQPIETIDGFWFSWLAVHPDTELYTK